jgi:hypothetical protein
MAEARWRDTLGRRNGGEKVAALNEEISALNRLLYWADQMHSWFMNQPARWWNKLFSLSERPLLESF